MAPPGEYDWTVRPSAAAMRSYVKYLLWPLVIIISRPHRNTTYVDAAYCYWPSSVICLGSRYPYGKGQFCVKVAPIVNYRHFLLWAVQKRLNRSRCRLGCWVGWPKEPRIRWGYRSPMGMGTFEGKSMPDMSDDALTWRELCKNGWTDRDAVWVKDSGGSKEPCIRCSDVNEDWMHKDKARTRLIRTVVWPTI